MNHIAMQKTTNKKSRVKKKIKKKSKPDTEENITEENITEENNSIPVIKKEKKIITYETIIKSYDDILSCIDSQIILLRQESNKNKGGNIKFLRSLNKKIKILKNQNSRILKKKPKTKRNNNQNSGFLKPVNISSEMAKFTGWDNEELKSRVDVTKYICNYIKENDLQNPEDRRQIKPDKKLSKLLNFNPKTNKEPLRYYSLQTYLKKHFPKK